MFDHSKSKIRELFLSIIKEAHDADENCKPYEFKIFQSNGDRLSGKLDRFDGRNLAVNVYNKVEGHFGETVPVVLFSEQVSTVSLESSALIDKISQALSVDLEPEDRFTSSVLCEHMFKPLLSRENLRKPLSQRLMSYIYISSLNTGSLKLVGNVIACDDDFLILHSERLSNRHGQGEQMCHQLQLVNLNDVSSVEQGLIDMNALENRSARKPHMQRHQSY